VSDDRGIEYSNPPALIGALLSGAALSLAFLPVPSAVVGIITALGMALGGLGLLRARRDSASTGLPRAALVLGAGAILGMLVVSATGTQLPI